VSISTFFNPKTKQFKKRYFISHLISKAKLNHRSTKGVKGVGRVKGYDIGPSHLPFRQILKNFAYKSEPEMVSIDPTNILAEI
jgi:hypothetical protein